MNFRLFTVLFFLAFIAIGNDHDEFIKFTIKNGLPHSAVTGITQDKNGFIWLGTGDGLCKYDGYTFKVYQPNPLDPEHSIAETRVREVYYDSKNRIWAGHESEGITIFDLENETFSFLSNDPNNSNSLIHNTVMNFLETSDGSFWIGTLKGLSKYDERSGTFTNYKNGNGAYSISDNIINNLLEYPKGTLWVSTRNGLNKINLHTGKVDIVRLEKLKDKGIQPIFELSVFKDDLLISTAYGLFKLDINSLNPRFTLISSEEGEEIEIDEKERLWQTSSKSGIKRFKINEKTADRLIYDNKKESSISGNDIAKIFKDKEGNMWIGTHKSGLNLYITDRKRFTSIREEVNQPTSLSDNSVWAFVKDRQNNYWIGTEEGHLDFYSGQEKRYYHLPGFATLKFKSKFIGSLLEDKKGNIWIGSYENGLSKLIPGKGSNPLYGSNIVYYTPNLGKNVPEIWSVRSIIEDSGGKIWIGGIDKGVSVYDPVTEKFTNYLHDPKNSNSLSSEAVWNLYEDRKGFVWVCTNNHGLDRFDPQKKIFEHFNYIKDSKKAPIPKCVMCMLEDSKGRLWLGTGGGGLCLFSPEKGCIERFDVNQGLSNNTIYSIFEDNRGYLWISTNRGLNKFDPEKKEFIVYSESDGIQSNEFNPGAGFKAKDGWLYFGGINGLTAFHPDSIFDRKFEPNLVITEFEIFNKSIPLKPTTPSDSQLTHYGNIELKYTDRFISFEFASLDFISPGNVKYAYMMEGFDRDWIYTDASRRYASYTNVQPGSYTFKVKSTNGEGIWSSKMAVVSITITPPIWETWWFRFFSFALIILVAGFIIWYRFRSIRLQKEELERQVEQRTEEITIKNSQLKVQQEELIAQSTQLHEIDQMKLRFFTNVSHEFRTPLTLILGPLETLMGSDKHPERLKWYRHIQSNSLRLLRLANQLMDNVKMESGDLSWSYHPTNIAPFAKDITDSFQPLFEKKQLELTFSSDLGSSRAMVDTDKFEKILYNLLSNAYKFTPRKGKVDVRLYKMVSENDATLNGIRLEVSDTGVGIMEHEANRIFDRFYQATNNIVYKGMGTGIGLSLVKWLVDIHQGTIKVKSIPGEGTLFIVELPLEFLNEEPSAELPSVSDQNNTLEVELAYLNESDIEIEERTSKVPLTNLPLVLIVDDNYSLRNYLKHILTSDYTVIEAENGEEAWELLQKFNVQIVVSDVMMPVTNGLQLCEMIKSDINTSHIPVLLLTAKSDTEQELQGLQAGADDYVTKPFHISLLKARVKNLIHSRKNLRELFVSSKEMVPEDISSSPLDHELLKKLIAIIELNISNTSFNADSLIKESGLSRSNLYRKVEALTGLSLNLFVRNIKLKSAAALLKEGNMNVTEIAYETGFSSPAFFIKCFREQFGVTPKDFSNQHK